MPHFTIQANVSDQFILDVMTTIIESGALYWVERIKFVDRAEASACVERFSIRAENGDGSTFDYVVDAERIQQAIQVILDGEVEQNIAPYIVGYIISAVREDDAGDIDMEAADVIAQMATIGGVVYG